MEALIRPEFGLTFWTILCFGLLVLLLSRTAWKPLMDSVNERERAELTLTADGPRRGREDKGRAGRQA